MSEKSGEMQATRDEIFTSKYCEPKYSANGAYQMFSEGFDKCYELMIEREYKRIIESNNKWEKVEEREAKLKAQLDLALSTFKNHALDCSEGTVFIYERLLDKLEAIK